MATRNWAVSADSCAGWDGSASYAGDCDHLPAGYLSWLGGAARSFLKFTLDWSGVVQITKAELKIKTSTGYHGSIGGSNTTYVDLVTSSWAEASTTGETWSGSNPSYSESVNTAYRCSFTARATSTWYTCDITAIVNRWAPSSVKQSNGAAGPGTTNNGIRLIASNESNTAYRTEFLAREAGSSDAYIVLTYTTNQVPTVQSYDSPTNGATITDDTPSLVFTLDDPDAADTVVAYDIQVDDVNTFASPAVNLTNQAIGSPANTVQVTHVCSALTRGATYYWRALGRDNQGGVGAWGATQQFYLAHLPGVDTLSPTANAYATIHNLGDTALWTDGSFAKPRLSFRYTHTGATQSASYRIQVYDAASGGNQVADTGTVAWVAAAGTTKVVDLATAMPRNTSRWWEVTIVDAAGGSVASGRQQFRVNWGQALYEANPGAGSSAWDFDLGAVANGSAVARFRTATQSGSGGSFGTTSAWTADIGSLTPAAYLNVLVRLAPTTAGTNVTLGSMVFRYLGSSVAPDNWVRGSYPGGQEGGWTLSTAQRRFGAKALKCSVVGATSGERFVYPYRLTPGDDIPVIPGVTYTWSAYVNTPVPLTGGELDARIYLGGGFTFLAQSEVVQDTTGEPDGWVRLVCTYTVPAGITSVRPAVYYHSLGAVTEAFYVDGAKHEEGPVATPWQAGAIGAVILDSGGVVVDQVGGGTLRLRGGDGTAIELGAKGLDVILPNAARGLSNLGSDGVVFGSDTILDSPSPLLLRAGDTGSFASRGVVSGAAGAATNGYWTKVAHGSLTAQYQDIEVAGHVTGWGDSGGNLYAALVRFRVKQQAAFGNQPDARVTVLGDWPPDRVAVVITSAAGPTTWELWVRTITSYQYVVFAPVLVRGSNDYIPDTGVALQAATPTGTVYYGTAPTLQGTIVASGLEVASGAMLRYIPLDTISTVVNAAAGQTSDQTVEVTAIPANTAVYAEMHFGVRGSTAGDNFTATLKHYDGTSATQGYTSGYASRGGWHTGAMVKLGGTNGRQMKWATSATTGCTFWLYADGYWVPA